MPPLRRVAQNPRVAAHAGYGTKPGHRARRRGIRETYMSRTHRVLALLSVCHYVALAATPAASTTTKEFALILTGPAVSAKFSRAARSGFEAQTLRTQIRESQAVLRKHLEAKRIPVTGSADTLINAVFVSVPTERMAELSAIPGVATVALAPRLHRTLDKALDLQNVKQAWNNSQVGGQSKAGAGVKIAIIDTGIDQTHPAFVDSTLRAPAGYPIGDGGYTNSKVIVARSYVTSLSSTDPAYSTPDDNSPRDRVGHGTALAMIAAGNTVAAPVASITGVAPKAYLGNYKIFGSPGVNDNTATSALVQALEDAYNDGMDIAVLSLGTPAFNAALDQATACQQTQFRSYIPATACDVNAYAVEHAVLAGLTVVVSAGNDGCAGINCPTLGTINSPGTSPSAITVGSTLNAHIIYSKVKANGQTYNGISGNGPHLQSPLTAAVVDVSTLGNDGTACTALTASSLSGSIALVKRGTCAFFTKVDNAYNAGAVAVLMYDTQGDSIFQPTYLLNETGIPLEFIGLTAGTAIKSAMAATPGLKVTIDPTLTASPASYDAIAFDSSRGPAVGTSILKPDLVAVGSGIYTATQNFDPNADTYDVSRFTSVDGTSFAAAMVAGAAALVKQAHPGYTPAQLKSAVVNTATTGVILDDFGAIARTTAVGGGKLDANAAVSSNITASPATVSFGQLTALGKPVSVAITNTGSAAANISISVAARDKDGNATVSVSPNTLSLQPGQSQNVTVSMTGKAPTRGTYEGQVNISGGSVPLHLPYSYIVAEGIPNNSFPIFGDNYFGVVTEYPALIAMRVIDQFGAPVINLPVQWGALNGGTIDLRNADVATDNYGIAAAYLQEPNGTGFATFRALTAGNYGWDFTHIINYQPSISGGVLNAANQQAGNLAPGSYATIAGTDFSSVPLFPSTSRLPIALGEVSVSFDAGGISVPAPISYMSFNQINIQIPWEMAGQASAKVKVNYHGISGPSVTVPLAPTSPAFFEYTDAGNSQLSVVAQDSNYNFIGANNGAGRGKAIVLYANGLGAVNDTPPTGALTPTTVLSRTTTLPTVTIGGKNAQVLFSGMVPLAVGFYQINVTVPADAPTGLQPIVLAIGGVTSKQSQIVVQ